ncbi:hypothetical protein AWC38_SpisGene20143 [Stylophora pistillata]|uniref:Mutator-like transposase domain-containing protein n=1 Tax=Stylophora pistillata TaxID=50429 RepID=A0A2B4RH91_STYPI|nr:hypothetical protein AWC38_SpisGene20143 [Stylophora pistillata]
MVIQYYQRCFGYALKQSKDDEEGVRNGLRSIVPHAYGDHSSCGNWCGYLKNNASYKHRGLPHGKDLIGKSLRQSLEEILEIYASNTKKLAPLGSNQVHFKQNRFLVQAAEKNGVMEDLVKAVSGFTLSLPAFRELLLERKSHSQENLVQDLLCKSYEAHNARADVQTLYQLVNNVLNVKLLQQHSFKVSWVASYQKLL